jgi:hypothetical protein
MTKDKAIELIDVGVGQALASFFQNQAAVLTGGGSARKDQLPRLLIGLEAFFWAREQAVIAIEEGRLSGIEKG